MHVDPPVRVPLPVLIDELLGGRCPLKLRNRVKDHLRDSPEVWHALDAAYELGGFSGMRPLLLENLSCELYAAVVEWAT